MFTRRKFFAKVARFCAVVGLPVAAGAVFISEDELHYTIENFPSGRRIYLNGLDVTNAAFECKFRGGVGWVKMFTYDIVDGKAKMRIPETGWITSDNVFEWMPEERKPEGTPIITRYGRIEIR